MQVEHHTNALVNTINMNTTVAGLAEQVNCIMFQTDIYWLFQTYTTF